MEHHLKCVKKPLAAHVKAQHIIDFEREDYVGCMFMR